MLIYNCNFFKVNLFCCVLIVVFGVIVFFGKEGDFIGLFILEVFYFYNVFCVVGFEVDLLFELGSYYFDVLFLIEGFFYGEDFEVYIDINSEFCKKFDNMFKVLDFDFLSYGLFFVFVGYVVLIDYLIVMNFQCVVFIVWVKGGVVLFVCYGLVIFVGVIDEVIGELFIKGKCIIGFIDEGEEVFGVMGQFKSWNKEFVQELVVCVGVMCK